MYCRTNFSFLEAASHPDELAEVAASLGYNALAITDTHGVPGVVRAHAAAKELGLKLIVGAEVSPQDAPPIVLLATDRGGYGNLCQLLTLGRRRAKKGECLLTFADIARHAGGLLAGVPLWPHVVSDERIEAVRTDLDGYREAFGDRAFAMAALFHGPEDGLALARMRDLAKQARLPLVATNAPLMHVSERRFLLAALWAIREGKSLRELTGRLPRNGERYLKSGDQLRQLFGKCPELVRRTLEIANRCAYRSIEDLAGRTGLPKQTLSLLAKAAVFDSLSLARRQATWQALGAGEASPLFDATEQSAKAPALPALSPPEEVAADYRDLGLSLRGHPVQFLRPFLERRRVRPCGMLGSFRNGAFVTTAGIVLLRQRPSSAKGITFMTLEDETGQANLVVYPDVWERFRREARRATALQVSGQLQHDTGGTTHLVAARLVDLSDEFEVAVRSRDFH